MGGVEPEFVDPPLLVSVARIALTAGLCTAWTVVSYHALIAVLLVAGNIAGTHGFVYPPGQDAGMVFVLGLLVLAPATAWVAARARLSGVPGLLCAVGVLLLAIIVSGFYARVWSDNNLGPASGVTELEGFMTRMVLLVWALIAIIPVAVWARVIMDRRRPSIGRRYWFHGLVPGIIIALTGVGFLVANSVLYVG